MDTTSNRYYFKVGNKLNSSTGTFVANDSFAFSFISTALDSCIENMKQQGIDSTGCTSQLMDKSGELIALYSK